MQAGLMIGVRAKGDFTLKSYSNGGASANATGRLLM